MRGYIHPGFIAEQRAWARGLIVDMPAGVQQLLWTGWQQRWGDAMPGHGSPVAPANRWLRDRAAALKAAHVTRAYDEQLIRDCAASYARLCARMHSLESRQSFASWFGIESPSGRLITRAGACARLDDPLWWRRQLRKRWTRASENGMRELGAIRKGRQPYASDEAVRHRGAQRRRGREYLSSHVVVNEQGEQLNLWELAERSLANPAIRRGEFMVRVRGFEEIAADMGHVAEFVTLTCPSYFHAQLAAGGENPAYQRATVREAQGWLCKMWARARAKLKRLSVMYYGVRIAEPHHDGTPHWHMLLFAAPAAVELLRKVLRGVWLSEYAAEPGAEKHRIKFETIDPRCGSAAGYVAKYVSKNIDGEGDIGGSEDWETGVGVDAGIARVHAWASVHGIRQFQQIGGVPVGLWREVRRIRESVDDADIERARAAADAGDWRAFSYAVSNDRVPGRRTALQLEKHETGEVNRYGECRGARVVGVRYASAVAITRPHRWRIEKNTAVPCSRGAGVRPKCEPGRFRSEPGRFRSESSFLQLGPVAITVRDGSAPAWGDPVAWTGRETSMAGPQ